MQYGKAAVPDISGNGELDISIEAFAYKQSLEEDMRSADVVIGHAGAGTILEALDARKKMVVVINDNLMHNHQAELAMKMQERKHLVACTCSTLLDTLRGLPDKQFEPYTQQNAAVVGHIADVVQDAKADALKAEAGETRPSMLVCLVGVVLAFFMAHFVASSSS